MTPCSPRCAVWLLYGIQPLGVTSRTVPGQCKGRAHRRSTLGLPGRRVLVSRKWSGKTLDVPLCSTSTRIAQRRVSAGQSPDGGAKRRWLGGRWPVSPVASLPAEVAGRSDENPSRRPSSRWSGQNCASTLATADLLGGWAATSPVPGHHRQLGGVPPRYPGWLPVASPSRTSPARTSPWKPETWQR